MLNFKVSFTLILTLSSVSTLDVSTSELIKRLEFLEKQGKQQAVEIANQRQELIKEKIRHEIEAEEHRAHLSTLQKLVQEQGETINALTDKIAVFEETEIESKKHLANNTVYSRSVYRRQEGPVAFQTTVRTPDQSSIAVGQKVIYDTVELNVGGGYKAPVGVFTAPQAGMYIFSTSIMGHYKPNSEIWVGIVKNGVVLANAFAYGDADRDQGAVTVVTQLTAGDQVWVELLGPASDSLWGYNFSSFMGCLVDRF